MAMEKCCLIVFFLIVAVSAKSTGSNASDNSTVSMLHCTKALHLPASKNIATDSPQLYKPFVSFDLVFKTLKPKTFHSFGNEGEKHFGQRPVVNSVNIPKNKYGYIIQTQLLILLSKKREMPSYKHKIHQTITDTTVYNEVIIDRMNGQNNIYIVDESKPLKSEDKPEVLIGEINHHMKEPDTRINSLVEDLSRHKEVRIKRCVGDQCDKHEDKDCEGLSEEMCKDVTDVTDGDKLKKKKNTSSENKNNNANGPLILFEPREIVGFVLIFILAGFLIYLMLCHGGNDYIRRFMTFGIMILFLLFITLGVEMFSRSPISIRD